MSMAGQADPLGTAVVALMVFLLLAAIVLRLTAQRGAVPALLGCAAAVFLLAVASIASALENAGTWRFAAFYACGVAVVIFIYGAVLKSLSLRMLVLMATLPRGEAGVDQLTEETIAPAFDERIRLLQESGLIAADPAGYTATGKGTATASQIARLRAFLDIEASGLYSGRVKATRLNGR